MNDSIKVAMIGGGSMGEAVIAGLVRAGGWHITVVETSLERREHLASQYAVTTTPDAITAAAHADVVVIVVKPKDVPQVLSMISGHLRASAVVVSLAAGLRLEKLESHLPQGTAVVRVMPNTPALVGQGMSVFSPNSFAGPDQIGRARDLMLSVGKVLEIPEADQDAATAVSGSGPAYVFLVAEAMIAAAQELGLSDVTANLLVTQTIKGAGELLSQSADGPAELRAKVSSPGGTTMAAIGVLQEEGLEQAFSKALARAKERSIEMASE